MGTLFKKGGNCGKVEKIRYIISKKVINKYTLHNNNNNNKRNNNMKCKECIYYSGVQCHGHGEFWGTCQLLDNLFKYMERTKQCDYIKTDFKDILDDNTECIIIKNLGFKPCFIGEK